MAQMPDTKKFGRVTQRDIARHSRVSQATVSRVIAGDERVDRDTTERVKQAIVEFNYKPNVRARSFRSQSSGLIGLVFKRPVGGLHDDPFFSNLGSEIMDFLVGQPYHLCLDVATTSTQQDVYDEMLRTRRVDGLILVESEARDPRIKWLQEDNFPFVLIGNADEIGGEKGNRILSVDNDNVLAGELATSHLLDQGFNRVGILAGPHGVTVSEDRIEGYCRAVSRQKQEPLIWHSEFGLDNARSTGTRILMGRDRPDALVVLDDFMAMGVVLAARSSGTVIPRDLGLVSFNDTTLCHLIDGGLSSVSLNIREIVQSACCHLLDLMEGKSIDGPRRVIVPTRLIVRGSSIRTREAGA